MTPARRQSILDAALACFLERGYRETTIANIRDRSGASTGSIYHFFAGKGALASALLDRAVTGWSAASTPRTTTPEAAIKASTHGLVIWGLNNPALARFIDEIRTLAATDPDFAEVQARLAAGQAAAAASYRDWVAAGSVRDMPWPLAHSLMLGPAYNYLRLAGPMLPGDIEAAADALAAAAWDAVRA